MKALLSGLNDAQRLAAEHVNGPMVVFAGAGSGKTRIITHRIANLIRNGVPPWTILAVTFTNKAAGEMKERVIKICPEAGACHIATFHSAAARWLREFASELGFTADFSIYDDSDSNQVLKSVMQELLSEVDLSALIPEIKGFIHMAKTSGLLPTDIERRAGEMGHLIPHGGIKVYMAYQERLAKCNAMDFGDLLLNMLLLLRRNKGVRGLMQRRFRYVLVDEYQDTNPTQFEIVQHIVAEHQNLFVVGDDDQSIYSWRGATPANILHFEQHFAGAKRVTMEQNYRSSNNIISAAGAMIQHNEHRAKKKLFTENPSGDKIDFIYESDGEMEAFQVVDQIRSESSVHAYGDIAIFYRTNSQTRLLEDALRRERIPYRIYGSLRFYDRMEVKDIVAYMRLAINPRDDVALKRVINTPTRGIGAKAVQEIEKMAQDNESSLLEAMRALVTQSKSRLGSKLAPVVLLLDKLAKIILTAPLDEVISHILHETNYGDYVKKKFPDQYLEKLENVHELAAALADYDERVEGATLSSWLQTVSLDRDEEADANQNLEKGVSLMTLHMAKGLEYDRVYIVGVEEGFLPHHNSTEDPRAVEEERRLLYVGITRARVKLSLLGAHRRRVYNQTHATRPSRFMNEIPPELLSSPRGYSSMGLHLFDDPQRGITYEPLDAQANGAVHQIRQGAKVYHATYGSGQVELLEEVFGEIKATVHFDEFGHRVVAMRHLVSR